MSKDTRIPVRVSSELKAAFEAAAARDETTVSGWLRWLGEHRLEELELELAAVGNENGNGVVAPFVPGA